MPSPAFCRQCGVKLEPEAAFCTNCGTPVSPAVDTGARPSARSSAPSRRWMAIIGTVLIIGMLGAFFVTRSMGRLDDARSGAVKMDLASYMYALDLYKRDNGRYPTTEQGLQALVTKPASGPPARRWRKDGYISALKPDPWERPYQYASPGSTGIYDLYTLGADGKPGGTGPDADVGSQDEAVVAFARKWIEDMQAAADQAAGKLAESGTAKSESGFLAWLSGLMGAGKVYGGSALFDRKVIPGKWYNVADFLDGGAKTEDNITSVEFFKDKTLLYHETGQFALGDVPGTWSELEDGRIKMQITALGMPVMMMARMIEDGLIVQHKKNKLFFVKGFQEAKAYAEKHVAEHGRNGSGGK